MNEFTVIIPARLASTRLPEKLLQKIGSKSVLEHSYLAAKSSAATRVVIAADDKRLVELAQSFNAEVILTNPNHQSGTDRLAECVSKLRLANDELVVNLQGDEPFMPADMINRCASALYHSANAVASTLACRLHSQTEIDNPNVVKVVIDNNNHALYFSRAPIPYNRDNAELELPNYYFHHLGIYAYRVALLKQYATLTPSPLEEIEKLEQLRLLGHGYKMAVAIIDKKPVKGIDTIEDLENARLIMSAN